MKNFLYISNKYVTGLESHSYYADFLRNLHKSITSQGNNLDVVFFSENMKPILNEKWTKYFAKTGKKISQDEINALEKKYRFTFRQAIYPDILQVFPTQLGRTYHVPERYMKGPLEEAPEKFIFLEHLFDEKKYEFVFVDQSPEYEMEFARAISHVRNIPFVRYTWSALGRTTFHLQKRFGEEDIIKNLIEDYSYEDAAKWVDHYVKNSLPPYPDVPVNRNYKKIPILKKIQMQGKEAPVKIFNVIYRNLAKIVFKFETFLKDRFIYDDFDKDKNFLFFGFHLPIESTVGLRSLPYLNQITLVELVSRCLPTGYVLYIREHPWWRDQYPLSYLLKAKKLANVKLISPKIPISEILKHTKGVLTLNATTGIEALLRGKPVLSFAENVYSDFHPAALRCNNPFLVGEMLAKLIATPVKLEDTVNYLKDLHNSSIELKSESFCLVSEQDAKNKAEKLSQTLMTCLNKVSQTGEFYQA